MFRRAASLLQALPRDGDLVEARGRLAVYEPRGDLQLVVESLGRTGQGALYEQFLRLKARLESEGLFDAGRKRPLPASPRAIGVVTSLGAAALHDVVTALRRRVPHIPVIVAPALVQGGDAPADLARAIATLGGLQPGVDVILLVRGGGSIEDLWAFNDERLARAVVASPVPVVCGVGHETDVTIADFCADLRAPTPTAAAEMVAVARDQRIADLSRFGQRLGQAVHGRLDVLQQRLDLAGSRLGRPSARLTTHQLRLAQNEQRLRLAVAGVLSREGARLQGVGGQLVRAAGQRLAAAERGAERIALRLELLDPRRVLQRGYAFLSDPDGRTVTSVVQTRPGQSLRATLADGEVDLTVTPRRLI